MSVGLPVQQNHGMGGNSFLSAGKPHHFRCGALQIDHALFHLTDLGKLCPHGGKMGGKFRFLSDNGDVGIAQEVPLFPGGGDHLRQQLQAGDILVGRVMIGKMAADVPGAQGAEDRVAQGMGEHVGVGVA